MFLGEFKYIVKEKKISRYINDDLEIFPVDSHEEISGEKAHDEK